MPAYKGKQYRDVIQLVEYQWQDWRHEHPNNIRNGFAALCDDGGIWRLQQAPGETTPVDQLEWKRLPDIPRRPL